MTGPTYKPAIIKNENIKNLIYTVRGLQVMVDRDLAELYGVETKRLNEQVKRNIERFPREFCFQLTAKEDDTLRSHFATSNTNRGGRRYLPYVFTEQGVAMLSGVLKSRTAVKISIQIINAFVAMRKFIATNGQIFKRLNIIEQKQLTDKTDADKKFKQLFDAIEERDIVPQKGVFFEGQVFDAHKLVSNIVRSAKKSIILIDNYIDDTVLTILSKRKKNIEVTIHTKTISKQMALDVQKYNSQHPTLEIKNFKNAHDRFLIIDDKDVYHFGASLKDLGKKWFAFSKFNKEAFKLIERLKKE